MNSFRGRRRPSRPWACRPKRPCTRKSRRTSTSSDYRVDGPDRSVELDVPPAGHGRHVACAVTLDGGAEAPLAAAEARLGTHPACGFDSPAKRAGSCRRDTCSPSWTAANRTLRSAGALDGGGGVRNTRVGSTSRVSRVVVESQFVGRPGAVATKRSTRTAAPTSALSGAMSLPPGQPPVKPPLSQALNQTREHCDQRSRADERKRPGRAPAPPRSLGRLVVRRGRCSTHEPERRSRWQTRVRVRTTSSLMSSPLGRTCGRLRTFFAALRSVAGGRADVEQDEIGAG